MKFKKIIAVCSAVLMLSTVTGCGVDNESTAVNSSAASSESIVDDSSVQSEETQEKQENAENSQTQENVIGECDGYKVIDVCLGDNVYYPQITGMSDTAVEDKINKRLKDSEQERYDSMDYRRKEAEKMYQKEKESGTLNSSMEQVYKEAKEYFYKLYTEVIYADENYLSMKKYAYFGTTEEQEAKSGGVAFTSINLDMKTGEDLEISNIVDTLSLAEKIYSGEGITVTADYDNPDLKTDFLEDNRIKSVEDVKEHIDNWSNFSFDENGKITIVFSASKGALFISEK